MLRETKAKTLFTIRDTLVIFGAIQYITRKVCYWFYFKTHEIHECFLFSPLGRRLEAVECIQKITERLFEGEVIYFYRCIWFKSLISLKKQHTFAKYYLQWWYLSFLNVAKDSICFFNYTPINLYNSAILKFDLNHLAMNSRTKQKCFPNRY